MQKPKLSTIELVFVIIAASSIFAVTFHHMSTAGILPGNDPAVHLLKAKKIVLDERVSYSEIAWYPPVFHTILAILQIFAGTLDVMVAAFILKMLIATLSVLLLLSTYLLSRKLFGTSIAVSSVVFTIISVPLFEMVFWGGYANFLGFAYIAFIFYIITKDFQVAAKTLLLFLGSFTLVLSHQLSTFVFVLMFVPTFLASTIGSRKKLMAFLAIIVGGGLALLAWYARVIIDYAYIIIDYMFSSGAESFYHIDSVTFDALFKNLGITLFLTVAGIPLTFILIKRKKATKSSLLIVFWLAIPFLLSQSFLFGIHLPYHRFVYFFATPIAILSAVTVYSITELAIILKSKLTLSALAVYCSTQLPTMLKSKLIQKLPRKREILAVAHLFTIALVLILVAVQVSAYIERTNGYPQFYERAPIAIYKSGIWVNQHSTPDDTMVVPISPGSWFPVFSDRYTSEETDPLYSRNLVAETVLYSFYEMENGRTLTHEYNLASPNSGQEVGVAVYKIWRDVLTIPNNHVRIVYLNSSGKMEPISLSETVETIYWTQKSTELAQMVSEYTHELFTVKKVVTFSSNSSIINIVWKIETHQDLPNANLGISNYMEPSLNFTEALIPGVLEWQNPWDNPSTVEPENRWAVIEGPPDILDENVVAILDPENGILAVFELGESLEWFNLGALTNRFIDTLRLNYELGNLTSGESSEVSTPILVYAFESKEVERLTASDLWQQYDSDIDLPVQQRDYLTFIEENNIKYIVIDTQQMPSNKEAAPDLDVVYNNGRTLVYATGR